MPAAPDKPNFWDKVRWITPTASGGQYLTQSLAATIWPALSLLGLSGAGVWLALAKASGPGQVLLLIIAVALALWVTVKAIREIRAIGMPYDAYGRLQSGYEPPTSTAEIVFFGPRFAVRDSPLSGEAFNLRDIMNGAPGVWSRAAMLTGGVVAVFYTLLVVFTPFPAPALRWGVPLAGGLVLLVHFIQYNWYMGGAVTPRRVEVWRWWPGRTAVFTPEDFVLHVVISNPLSLYPGRKARPWRERACARRQRNPLCPLMIDVTAVPRGGGRGFMLATCCDPASEYLARLLSLWVDAPITAMPAAGGAASQTTAGVFTPANPAAALEPRE